jgi:hypothetical protein
MNPLDCVRRNNLQPSPDDPANGSTAGRLNTPEQAKANTRDEHASWQIEAERLAVIGREDTADDF